VTDVVTDEGLFISALGSERGPYSQELVDEDEQKSREQALSVLQNVQDRHVWAVSTEVLDKCFGRLWQASYKGKVWRQLLFSFVDVLIDPGRHNHVGEPPAIEGDYHHKDRPWVSCAAAAADDCLLVTVDGDLVRQLNATDLPRGHRFIPVLVIQAQGHL